MASTNPPYPAPPGFRWVFTPYFWHWRAKRYLYAKDYGRNGEDIVKSCDASVWVGELPEATVRNLAAHSGRSADQVRAGYYQGSPADIEAKLRPFIDIGITRFVLNAGAHNLSDNWRRISEDIVPRFANG